MTATEAYARLSSLGVPLLRTSEVATSLHASASSATQLLNRLSAVGLTGKIRRGLWWVSRPPDPLTLPEHLTAPYPAYVSMHTALYHHGVLSQMAEVTYVATLGWPERVKTSLGTFSLHRLAPEVFGGFQELGSGVKLATVEKALFDMAYLSAGRSRLFAVLPELELERRVNATQLRRWISALEGRGPQRVRVINWFRRHPALKGLRLS